MYTACQAPFSREAVYGMVGCMKQKCTFTLRPETRETLAEMAARSGRSMSEIIDEMAEAADWAGKSPQPGGHDAD